MLNQITCPDAIPNFLGFFDFTIAPALLFYSYIPIIIIALFLSFFVFYKDKYSLQSKLLFLTFISFSLWIIVAIITWVAVHASIVHFSWEIIAFFEILIYIFSLYFVYVFLYKKDLELKYKISLALSFLPIVITLPTALNMISFNISNCQSNNGYIWYYIYSLEVIFIFIMIGMFYKKFKSLIVGDPQRKQVVILGIGVFLFLSMFTATNILGDTTLFYEINLFGPIGMVIFLGLMTFTIVRYKTFNIKLLGTQALVWGLAVLIGSQFFFIKVPTNFILNAVTFIGVIIFGQILIRSVKREVKQKEEIQKIAVELEDSNLKLTDSNEKLDGANEKLKSLDKLKTEFLSLASHQLRSPLTAIKGYTSMLLEGDFGAVNDKQKEAIDRVFDSSKHLTVVVEDLLNVSKIEQGGMQYIMAPFDFEKAVKDLATDLGVTAGKKGLELTFETDNKAPYTVNGDMEKLRQVILNLIDNSVKYTKEGWIKVAVTKDEINKKIKFAVSDSGMGISPTTINDLFQKFSRGAGGKVNTGGSGLGLYLGKEIVGAHKGRIWAESAGEGKGSTFAVELDMG